jgi:hypothetical protein
MALAAAVLAACGSGQAAAPPTPPPTVGDVGQLPDLLVLPTSEQIDSGSGRSIPQDEAPNTTTRRTTTTTRERPTTTDSQSPVVPVGRLADGNRVLMIGDSILAATAEPYSEEMCASLVPLGWSVEVNAETAQAIEFGMEVLDSRLRAGWDAVVIFLGNNYNGQPQAFDLQVRAIIERLAPRPVVLVTVSEYERRQAEVNYILRAMVNEYDQVRVVDWAAATAADDDLIRGDGLHPTDAGRQILVSLITSALGRAPRDGDGRPTCLRGEFTDRRD